LFCNTKAQSQYLRKSNLFKSSKLILLPDVNGRLFHSSRQYFKYALKINTKIDILHFLTPRLYPFFWLFPAKKFICTFHAGGDITASHDRFVLSRSIYNLVAKIFYFKIDSIVAVSDQGKKEISYAYKINPKRIDVIYSGADDKWSSVKIKNFSQIPKTKRIILVIGRWQKYKNIHTISRMLKNANSKDLKGLYFIFIGKKIEERIVNEIESDLSNVSRRAFSVKANLSDGEYYSLIKLADLVIFPSLNEGFGLPAFDAFSQGSRVLVHTGTPAAEILNGQPGVHSFDLSSSDQILEVIKSTLSKKKGNKTDNREYLISIGAVWEKAAENYLDLYTKISKTV
jgi:glycosyltransferase involved in cell wall biosynthesis